MEVWKDLNEWYEVSNQGKVRNKQTNYILKATPDANGYLRVNIRMARFEKLSTQKIHKLVATLFIPNPLNLPEVNHLKEKDNNFAENLEWSSHSDNMQHAFETNRCKRVLKEEQVHEVRKLALEGNSYGKIARIFNVDNNVIRRVLTGKSWGHI